MAEQHLRADRIVETVEVLQRRIEERFPEAGLATVCGDLVDVSRRASERSRAISRPIFSVRALSTVAIVVVLILFYFAVQSIRIPDQPIQGTEFIQVLDAAFNSVVLIGATIAFLVTWEQRLKRSRALQAVHELRSIAHVIDMHQLTKDPERLFFKGSSTKSSPKRTMSPFELSRYLDYCSEMLALIGKIAALYVEYFPDAQAVSAVNELESLTTSLARKMWQKIMILNTYLDKEECRPHEADSGLQLKNADVTTGPSTGSESLT